MFIRPFRRTSPRFPRRGATLLDYGLIGAVVLVLVVAAANTIAGGTSDVFQQTNEGLGAGRPGGPGEEQSPQGPVVAISVIGGAPNETETGFTGDTATEFVFGVTGDAADSYSWDFGDGTSSNSPTPLKQYSAGGTYPVTLIASTTGGSSTVSTLIEITTPIVLDTASFDTDASSSAGHIYPGTWGSGFVTAGTSTGPSYDVPVGHTVQLDISGNGTSFAAKTIYLCAMGAAERCTSASFGRNSWSNATLTITLDPALYENRVLARFVSMRIDNITFTDLTSQAANGMPPPTAQPNGLYEIATFDTNNITPLGKVYPGVWSAGWMYCNLPSGGAYCIGPTYEGAVGDQIRFYLASYDTVSAWNGLRVCAAPTNRCTAIPQSGGPARYDFTVTLEPGETGAYVSWAVSYIDNIHVENLTVSAQ